MLEPWVVEALAAGAQGTLAEALDDWTLETRPARMVRPERIISAATMAALCADAAPADLPAIIARADSGAALCAVPISRQVARAALCQHPLTPAEVLHTIAERSVERRDWQAAEQLARHPNIGRRSVEVLRESLGQLEAAAGTTMWALRAAAMTDNDIRTHSAWPELLLCSLAATQPDQLVHSWRQIVGTGQERSHILGHLRNWSHDYTDTLTPTEIRSAFRSRGRLGAAWLLDERTLSTCAGRDRGPYQFVDDSDMFAACAQRSQRRQIVDQYMTSGRYRHDVDTQLVAGAVSDGMAAEIAGGVDNTEIVSAIVDSWPRNADKARTLAAIWEAIRIGKRPAASEQDLAALLTHSERPRGEWLVTLASAGWEGTAELAAHMSNLTGDAVTVCETEAVAAAAGTEAAEWAARYLAVSHVDNRVMLDRYKLWAHFGAATLATIAHQRPGWGAAEWRSALILMDGWDDDLEKLLAMVDTVLAAGPASHRESGEQPAS